VKIDWFMKFLLLVIAVAASAIALRPYVAPAPVKAQGSEGYPVFVEPGAVMLRAPDGSRQVLGKMVVDLRNGNVWGFPTLSADPYPSSPTSSSPVTSHPFLLGKFALYDMDK
jgi:hypothetical protein